MLVADLPFRLFFKLLLLTAFVHPVAAQTVTCTFGPPIIKIDFGTESNRQDINLNQLKNYRRIKGNCPDDGEYCFASYSRNCFTGNWHSLATDHTAGDVQGRMLIVNASREPGPFFRTNIEGLKPGATYQMVSWLTNICRTGYDCVPTPPEVLITIIVDGKTLRKFATGPIITTADPVWKVYSAVFTMPAGAGAFTLQLDDLTRGGCGNDFAIDDISFQECVYPEVKKPVVAITKISSENKGNILTEEKPQPTPPTSEQPPLLNKNTTKVSSVPSERTIINRAITVPPRLSSRATSIAKKLEMTASELTIQLYDNGEIDGDTVSIYHNNQLVKDKAALSAQPVTIRITLEKEHPHHELVMVADNLGSIPPNTSLMVVTSKTQRYEVFISSNEQKSAKLVIDLKE